MINNGVGDNAAALQHIYPAECIGLGSTTELLDLAVNSVEHCNSDPANLAWDQMNNFPMLFPIAARVGFDPERLLQAFKSAIQELMRPNCTVYQQGGGIETSGSTETIHSMLLQSHEGVLRLFPVWPRDRDARFVNLRAVGGVLVSSEFKESIVQYVQVSTEKDITITIRNPWKGPVLVKRGRGEERLFGDHIVLSLNTGDTALLQSWDNPIE